MASTSVAALETRPTLVAQDTRGLSDIETIRRRVIAPPAPAVPEVGQVAREQKLRV
jgi:hypothetical protein